MKISACIIAKNEEENLPRLLESIKEKFDEIILVDTGSTDRTKEIAKEYGCKVYEKEWNGFADARNYAVEKATGDWIWFFDADMELEEKDYQRFKRILSIVGNSKEINGIRVIYRNIDEKGRILSLSSTVHIHRNIPELKWVGKIHERLVNERGDVITPPYPVYVNHYGYGDSQIMKVKIKRNLELLEEEIKELDKDLQTEEYLIKLFYLAQTYSASSNFSAENIRKAVEYCEEFLKINREKKVFDSNNLFLKHIYVYLLNGYINQKNIDKAEEFLSEALNVDSQYPDFHYIKGVLEENRGNTDEAIKSYIEFVRIIDKTYSSKSEDINIISDYSHNIKYLIEDKLPCMIKDTEDIKHIWKKEKGIYMGVLLANVYLRKGEYKEALKILNKTYRLHNEPYVGNKVADIYKNTDIKKAIRILEDIKNKNPNFSKTYYNLSLLYLNEGDTKKALEMCVFYVKRTKDLEGVKLLYKLLKLNGFYNEAKRLEKNFTK